MTETVDQEVKETQEEVTGGANQEVTAEQAAIHNMATTLCLSMLAELQEANEKHPEFFRSNAEALGVIRDMYLDVERVLLETKSTEAPESNRLKDKLKRLGAMCIKATYSRCSMGSEVEAISKYLSVAEAE